MWRLFLVLALALGDASCQDRCNLLLLRQGLCQCVASCQDSGTCCGDYGRLCVPEVLGKELPKPSSLTLPAPVVPRQPRIPAIGAALGGKVSVGDAVLSSTETCEGYEGQIEATVGGFNRTALLYVPEGSSDTPVWLVMHGTNQHAADILGYSGLGDFAKKMKFAYIAFQGLRHSIYGDKIRFNVGKDSEPVSLEGPDDVAYVRQVLDQVSQLRCLNMRRVYCTGYSNGGRFCSRLASELSDRIAAIAPVSGLRYPTRNNATRPMPLLAFHGDSDWVNPWDGHGATYRALSIQEVALKWAAFNGCSYANQEFVSWITVPHNHLSFLLYKPCPGHGTVEVMKMHQAGHQWPGARTAIPGIGDVHPYKANDRIFTFFMNHTLPEPLLMSV